MKHLPPLALSLLLTLIPACSSPDARLARLAERTTQQQADQNKMTAEVTKAASENHRRVIEAVEASRQEVVALEQAVQEQRDRLEDERQSLAEERHRESLLAPVVETVGLLLVAALPLVIAIYLLHGLRGQNEEEAVSEVMLRELLTPEAQLRLAEVEPRQRLEQDRSPQRPEEEPPF